MPDRLSRISLGCPFNAISLITLKEIGGAGRNRTDDLYNAIVALSQLSYGPTKCPANIIAGDLFLLRPAAPFGTVHAAERAWFNGTG